ncbi:MAG: 3-deoxy-manno-octulosonate cytidylyltransferase [Acidobacteriota bacterium]
MHVTCVIPARYQSTRFPGKPLAKISGKPMLQWVYEGVQKARQIDEVIIATDDERIMDVARSFSGKSLKVILTSREHGSGTDRTRDAVKNRACEVVINVQGDEPLVDGPSLDMLIEEFRRHSGLEMATLAEDFRSPDEIFDPNIVKVVTDRNGFALFFSRSPIPYFKSGGRLKLNFKEELEKRPDLIARYLKHQGIYGYRKEALFRLAEIRYSSLEEVEGLEQLRALEMGIKIKVLKSGFRSIGVDTPDDIMRVEKVLRTRAG